MSVVDVTAYWMGDPSARWVRQPTQAERERAGRYDVIPQGKCRGAPISKMGMKVRAMQPGDTLSMGYSQAKNYQNFMMRAYGWTMSHKRVALPDGSYRTDLRRIT